VQPLVGLRVRRVGDILQPTGDKHLVVGRLGEAQGAKSPRAGIVVVDRRLLSLLPHKVLPLVLELCLGSL
jgi:hypothetical protein